MERNLDRHICRIDHCLWTFVALAKTDEERTIRINHLAAVTQSLRTLDSGMYDRQPIQDIASAPAVASSNLTSLALYATASAHQDPQILNAANILFNLSNQSYQLALLASVPSAVMATPAASDGEMHSTIRLASTKGKRRQKTAIRKTRKLNVAASTSSQNNNQRLPKRRFF
ncbi:MAG: hypothetical protein Q9166_000656 [cf. Caloplaca sp. 2 TL-2023]